MLVVIQPNVVTRDRKAGVQTGEMVLITNDGIERMHAFPRGFVRVRSKSTARRQSLFYPLARRSSILLATSSQTAAKSKNSCLMKGSSAFSASFR